MLDELAIQQTINRYCHAANSREWDQVLSVFLPDAVWEVPNMEVRLTGHDEIRAGFAAMTTGTDYIVQINAPAIIEINGDTATAKSVIRECGKYSDRDEGFEALGWFLDQLKKTENGWKFAQRTLHLQGMHTLKVAPPAI